MRSVLGLGAPGAIATGVTETSTSITRTISTKITSPTSVKAAIEPTSETERELAATGSTIHNIAATLHTAIEERRTNLADAAPAGLVALAERVVPVVEAELAV